jgi:hypothetical protein
LKLSRNCLGLFPGLHLTIAIQLVSFSGKRFHRLQVLQALFAPILGFDCFAFPKEHRKITSHVTTQRFPPYMTIWFAFSRTIASLGLKTWSKLLRRSFTGSESLVMLILVMFNCLSDSFLPTNILGLEIYECITYDFFIILASVSPRVFPTAGVFEMTKLQRHVDFSSIY